MARAWWNGGVAATEIPRQFVIREIGHRIHNAFSPEKLARLGESIGIDATSTVLDLGCGSGELLCTWARDHGVSGIGIDLCSDFVAAAVDRSIELGVSDAVRFAHADASGYVATDPVDVAACLGATWIAGGVLGTADLLERSLRPGGLALVGEPFWTAVPPDDATARRAQGLERDALTTLPGLVGSFGEHGWDLVEMMLADPDDWDRYVAAQWLATRHWLDANAGDELWAQMRAELDTAPLDHVVATREYLGWGVFVLMRR